MNIINRIFDLFLSSIRLSGNISRPSKEVEILISEAKAADRRITRLETYVEILERNRNAHSHLKELL